MSSRKPSCQPDRQIGALSTQCETEPLPTIWFDEDRRAYLDTYLKQSDARDLRAILDRTAERIDGFESPLGMELLSTLDWLIEREHCGRSISAIRDGLSRWPVGASASERKQRLFNDRIIGLALERLASVPDRR